MQYTSEERKKIVEFLRQAIKLVEGSDIAEYKNMSDTLKMYFCVERKTNDFVG